MALENVVIFVKDATVIRDYWFVDGILCNPLATDSLYPEQWAAWVLVKDGAPARCRCQVATYSALGHGVTAEGNLVAIADGEELAPFDAKDEVLKYASNAVTLQVETDCPFFVKGDFLTSLATHRPGRYKVAIDLLLETLDRSPDFRRNIGWWDRFGQRGEDGELISDHPSIDIMKAARHLTPQPGQFLPVETSAGDKTDFGVLRLDAQLNQREWETTLFLVDTLKGLAPGSLLFRSSIEDQAVHGPGNIIEIAKVISVLRHS